MPFKYQDKDILGILPPGTIFKVNRVNEQGPRSWTHIFYYAEIISSENSEFIGKTANVSFLTDPTVSPQQFETEHVEEIEIN